MRLLAVLCTVLPVLGLSSQVLAAPAKKDVPKSVAPKAGAKVAPKKHDDKERHQPRDRKTGKLERASVTRVEQKVRDELSVRGHGEPSDAELMEWLSHGAPHGGARVAKKSDDKGGIERAGVKRGGAPKIEKSSAHKTEKKVEAEKVEPKTERAEKAEKKAEPKKGEPKKVESEHEKLDDKKAHEKKVDEKTTEKKAAKIVADEKKKVEPVCMGPQIDILRGTETDKVALTHCNGKADELGVLRLSVMARPGSSARPVQVRREEDLGASIKKVDAGLAERIATLSSHFAVKNAPAPIEIISGYRPNSKGSYHSHARAMDIRVQGARNEDVVAFCKTMQDTGCGYYPNSGFVHVDVRDPGTGHISWIDASGPGESPRYVATWPLPGKSEEAAETGSAKAKTAASDKAEKVEKADEPSAKSDDEAEAADKSAAAQAKPEAAPTPSKPEEPVKKSDKAKPESEGDLPKLPAPATGD